jgi:Bacterial Ig domain
MGVPVYTEPNYVPITSSNLLWHVSPDVTLGGQVFDPTQFQVTGSVTNFSSSQSSYNLVRTGTGALLISSGTYSGSAGSITLVGTGGFWLDLNSGGILDPGTSVPPVLPPVNRPPVAAHPSFVLASIQPLIIPKSSLASDPDGDPLYYFISSPPQNGHVTIESDTIVYRPYLAYAAGDLFRIQCSDLRGGVAESMVVIENPFAQREGTYFSALPGVGALHITIDRLGAGTFKLRIQGAPSAAGRLILNPAGPTEVSLPDSDIGNKMKLVLAFSPQDPSVLEGTVTGLLQPVTFLCQKRSQSEILAQYSGQFNLELTAASDSIKSRFGFAIVQVKPDGTVRVAGRLPNGKTWSAGSETDELGTVLFNGGSRNRETVVSGRLNLTSVAGGFDWEKRRNFSIPFLAAGGRFEKQTTLGLNVFGDTRTRARFSIGADFAEKRINLPIRIDGQNKVTQLAPVPPIIAIFIKSDGRFSGSFFAGNSRTFIHFTGILQSNPLRGLGVATDGGTGYVIIDPIPDSSSSGAVVSVVGTTGTTTTTTDSGGLIKTGTGTLVIGGSDLSVGGVEDSTGFLKLSVDNTDKQ